MSTKTIVTIADFATAADTAAEVKFLVERNDLTGRPGDLFEAVEEFLAKQTFARLYPQVGIIQTIVSTLGDRGIAMASRLGSSAEDSDVADFWSRVTTVARADAFAAAFSA